jgi:hypothetical protein
MKTEIQKLDYCTSALKLKNDLEGGFLKLGEYLYNIKENNLWEASWGSWLEFTWELKMSMNVINKLMQIHRELVLGYAVNPEYIQNAGGWSVVSECLPVIKSKPDALKWLNHAQGLTRQDLRREIKEQQTGIPQASCHHHNIYTIEICQDCGQRVKQI